MPAKRANTERKRMAALAGLIRQHQHEHGFTQRQLGDAIPVSQSTIGRYLNAEGSVPDEDRIIAIANALEADPVEFLAAAGRLSDETFEAAVVDQLRAMRAQINRVEQTSAATHALLTKIAASPAQRK
jgi:transcriptional regulator with XRE-family HTH domain